LKIILTDHALLHCKQQALDPRMIIISIRKILNIMIYICRRLEIGTQVVTEYRNNKIIIVIVKAKKRQKNKKERRSLGRGGYTVDYTIS